MADRESMPNQTNVVKILQKEIVSMEKEINESEFSENTLSVLKNDLSNIEDEIM